MFLLLLVVLVEIERWLVYRSNVHIYRTAFFDYVRHTPFWISFVTMSSTIFSD